MVHFSEADVIRHPLVGRIVRAYDLHRKRDWPGRRLMLHREQPSSPIRAPPLGPSSWRFSTVWQRSRPAGLGPLLRLVDDREMAELNGSFMVAWAHQRLELPRAKAKAAGPRLSVGHPARENRLYNQDPANTPCASCPRPAAPHGSRPRPLMDDMTELAVAAVRPGEDESFRLFPSI